MLPSKKDLSRPLSPHLTIYNLVQWSSGLSILHRLSGVGLFFGIGFGSMLLVYGFYNEAATCSVISFIFSHRSVMLLGGFVACMLLTSLCYHFVNGIRFVYLDCTTKIDKVLIKRSALVTVVVFVAMLLALLLPIFF
jgi:succinate dehydrogenase / fumarate reductase, cytochrome b subunit